MRSYTRKVMALWGSTRSMWGAMPLYSPLKPSRATVVRNACNPEPEITSNELASTMGHTQDAQHGLTSRGGRRDLDNQSVPK